MNGSWFTTLVLLIYLLIFSCSSTRPPRVVTAPPQAEQSEIVAETADNQNEKESKAEISTGAEDTVATKEVKLLTQMQPRKGKSKSQQATHPKTSKSPQQASKQKSLRRKEKSMEGEYLIIKFHQNDTEVELALDPQATNLNLELVRDPNGILAITKGDSMLFNKDMPDEKEKPEDLLSDSKNNPFESEDLTEDIISDINLAQKLFYERKYDKALQVLQESLQKKRTATAYALGGSIYYVNGDVDAAVAAWKNALSINPNLQELKELILRYKR